MESAGEQVRIDRAVYGGAGLARKSDGTVAFVPFALPGELVAIAPGPATKDASLLRVIESSEARIAPGCPHFGLCGGCQYQHAEYQAQLGMKRSILLETMQRAGVTPLPGVRTYAAEPWEYRNRVRFRVAMVEGVLRVGYSLRGTNEFLPILECPISAPILFQAAEACLEIAAKNPDAALWVGAAREIEFFTKEDSSALNMTLFVPAGPKQKSGSFARFCEAVQVAVPELSGASAVPAQEARGTSSKPIENWGAAGLAYRAADETYWVSRGGFFQVNRFLTDTLVRMVCGERHGGIAWDLYAGVGLFSRVLARSFAAVTAVEANPSAARDLSEAFAKLGAPYRAVAQSTLAFLREAVVQRERPELVVLDPPRAGAGVEVCELLLRIAAREMVYVSCDPTTLARDLVVLQREYDVASMDLVDLFPQTFHMETVVTLTRR